MINIAGVLESCAISTFCMTSSAFIAFNLSRYVFRNWFKAFILERYPKLYSYDKVKSILVNKFV
jgi:uncharacterized membrane protein YdjX (TVP38/TMEM64 family)